MIGLKFVYLFFLHQDTIASRSPINVKLFCCIQLSTNVNTRDVGNESALEIQRIGKNKTHLPLILRTSSVTFINTHISQGQVSTCASSPIPIPRITPPPRPLPYPQRHLPHLATGRRYMPIAFGPTTTLTLLYSYWAMNLQPRHPIRRMRHSPSPYRNTTLLYVRSRRKIPRPITTSTLLYSHQTMNLHPCHLHCMHRPPSPYWITPLHHLHNPPAHRLCNFLRARDHHESY
jgi:hypothetical protein